MAGRRWKQAGQRGRAVEQGKTSLFSVQGEALKMSRQEERLPLSFVFFWLHRVLAAACGAFSCSMWDL